jgi:hypothetical protein
MNKLLFCVLLLMLIPGGCKSFNAQDNRLPIAKAGEKVLYYDQLPNLIQPGTSTADSTAIIHNYINKWAKKELLFQKAEQNLTPEYKNEIIKQVEETRENLLIYQYQRQIMLEKMDTTLTEEEMENYYAGNEKSFTLSTNIVKALFIKVPEEAPSINKVRLWSQSNDQKDMQQLERYCYQFAEKFDDFNEEWITMDQISVELPRDIENQEDFLKRNTFYETNDSLSIYMIIVRDYRLRSSLAPYEYVRNDIKNLILNNRRFEFLQSLENGIYNEALKENFFKIF